MNKLLRYSFLLLLALVSSVTFAQNTVTFTAGTDKGAQTNAGNAGDKVTKDGITIETTTGNSAFAAAQYRFSKSSVTTFSSTVGNITKIVFTCTVSGDAKYGPGCFTNPSAGSYSYSEKVGTWTGDATSFTLTASSNQVRATKIEVTYTPSGDTPTPSPTVEKPTISGTTPFTDKTIVTITIPSGTTVYYTTDGSTPDDNGDEYTDPFELTATTTVKAVAYNAEGTAHSDVVSQEFVKQGNVSTIGDGTIANPYTVSDAIALTNALPADTAYYKGTIKYIKEVDTGSFGNATYSITTAGSTDTLLVYRGYYLQAKKFTAKDQIKVGDEVVIKGKLINYTDKSNVTTLELGTRNYIYSLNGKTTDETTVTPKDTANYTVAQAVAILTGKTETTDVVYVNGTVSQVDEVSSQYGNATYFISDDGTTANQLQVFRGKYLNNEKFTSKDQLNVGDKVKIAGVLTNHVNKDGTETTQEVSNSWIVSIISSTTPDEPTVETVALPYEESFSSDQGKFTINDVTVPENATAVWKIDAGQHYMKASGYVNRKNKNAESWLISPRIDLTKASDPRLAYMQTGKFFGTMADEASVWVKAEKDADWTQLTVPTYMTGNDWNFVNDTISLKSFVGKNVQIAFKYLSTEEHAGTWEIKNISVKDYASETPAEPVAAENIAAFNAADINATVALTLKDAQVTYSWTSNNGNTSIYLRDASGTTSIRNQKADAVQLGYKTGDVLNGTIVLTRSEYSKAIQGIINDKTDASTVTVSTGDAPLAKEITYTEAKENESNLVVLKNVDIVADDASTRATERFYIGTGDDRLQVYNGFHLADYTVAAATGVDVKGIITRYNDTYEIQPVEVPTTPTGINNIKTADDNANAPIYNLAGQRVSKNYKGVVIQNGKKHINK